MTNLQKLGATLLVLNSALFSIFGIYDVATGGITEATVAQLIQLLIAIIGGLGGGGALVKVHAKALRVDRIKNLLATKPYRKDLVTAIDVVEEIKRLTD